MSLNRLKTKLEKDLNGKVLEHAGNFKIWADNFHLPINSETAKLFIADCEYMNMRLSSKVGLKWVPVVKYKAD